MVRATDIVVSQQQDINNDIFASNADLFSDFAHIINAEELLLQCHTSSGSHDDFLIQPPCWDTPPESPDCSSTTSSEEYEFEINNALLSSVMDFDESVLPIIKAEKMPQLDCPIKPIKGSALMWNLPSSTSTTSTSTSSLTNNTASTTCSTNNTSSTSITSNPSTTPSVTTKQALIEPSNKMMWTPPCSPLPLDDDFDALSADLWSGDDLLMSVGGLCSEDLFSALDDGQCGNKRKQARLDDSSIESKKAKARQTRDEITMRTQAAISAAAASASSNKTETPELKRITHNVLERKRRNDLKLSYQELREQIPELKHVERAPTGQILLKAVEFVEQLKKAEQQLLHNIALAKAENEKLKSELLLQ